MTELVIIFIQKKGIQSKSHYDKEPVLDEDFPSMQEAAMMAKGCQIQRPAKSETKTSEMQEKIGMHKNLFWLIH